MHEFHRLAPPLPTSDLELAAALEREFTSPIERCPAAHWVVRSPTGTPFGLLSLTDVSLQHRRAEVLLGVLPEAPFAIVTTAMLLLFQFFFRVVRFNKLYSLVFTDNSHSLKSTLHLGFRQEGLLAQHILDPDSQTFVDLIQTGLLAQDAFSPGNLRLMRKLLR